MTNQRTKRSKRKEKKNSMDPCDIIDRMHTEELRMALHAMRNERNWYMEESNFTMDQLMHCKNKNVELKKEIDHYKGLYHCWEKGAKKICKELEQMEMENKRKDALIVELKEDRQLFAQELEGMVIEKDEEAIQAKKEEAIQEPVEEVKKDNGTQGVGQIVSLHWISSVYCWIILSLASIADSRDYEYSLDNKCVEKEKEKDKGTEQQDDEIIWKQDGMNEREENMQTIGKGSCSKDSANYYLSIIISKNEGRMMHKWNRSEIVQLHWHGFLLLNQANE